MIQIAVPIAQGLTRVTMYVVKNGTKIVIALISAAIVAIYEEISKYFMKRKLHKLYYNEGLKDGSEIADKLKEKLNEITKNKNLDDVEKLRQLKKYRKTIQDVENVTKGFEEEWDKVNHDKSLSESERKAKLDEIQQKFHQQMVKLGVID